MSEAIYFALNQLLLVAAVGCIVIWARLLLRHRRHPSWLLGLLVPVRPRERPCWSLADALVMFGTQLVLMGLLHTWMTRHGWLPEAVASEPPSPTTETLLANVALVVISGLGSCAAVLLRICLTEDQPIHRLGLIPSRSDLRLGLIASVMILPPVLLISALVSLLFPYQHQVLDLLKSVDTVTLFFAMFLATAVVTPFVEEFLFRVLIQGSLQGMIDRDETAGDCWRPRSYLPIIVASVIFSLMHLGQGAAPIPLFLLSLGLGYLYRQTGSITAPLVVHFVLNALTMIAKFTETAAP